MRLLRVGLDGRAFSSPAAGVRRYMRGLVPALLARDDVEVVALGGTDVPADVERVGEPRHPPTNLGWATVGLPRAAAAARVDVIHGPAYTGPLWSRRPIVLTVHDVSYERHPEWYPYRRDALRRAFYRRSATHAAHILTVSEFSAGEIGAAYGISRDRITVAPLGVDPSFAPWHTRTREQENPSTGTQAPEHPSTRAPFVLHVGDIHERRNLAVALGAVLAARRGHGLAVRMIVAGIDRGPAESLTQMASDAGQTDALVIEGKVSEARLRELYRDAAALVYPSRYEGFGIPLLEAMASGVPVIAARAGSIPEVVGEAATLLDPDDRDGWQKAITAVVQDEGLRQRMREAGLVRAADFTWARTAALTVTAYRKAAAR